MQIYNSYEPSTGRISLSKGNQLKFCVGGYWYKTDYLGYEGAAEIAASDLLEQSNIEEIAPFVRYEFEKIWLNDKKYRGCKSKDFAGKNQIITLDEFITKYSEQTAEQFVQGLNTEDKITKVVDFIRKNTDITNFGEYLTALFEFDAFIYNEDRHFNNIALLKSGKEYSLCPVFDNGAAFLSDIEIYGTQTKIGLERKSVKSKPFSTDFDEQIDACRALFGEQLKFSDNLELSPDVCLDILTNYGDNVWSRIKNTVDFSKNIHPEMLQNFEREI